MADGVSFKQVRRAAPISGPAPSTAVLALLPRRAAGSRRRAGGGQQRLGRQCGPVDEHFPGALQYKLRLHFNTNTCQCMISGSQVDIAHTLKADVAYV